MDTGSARKIWLALGASLAVSGGFAIVISLPAGGTAMWAGVGLVAAGSLALRVGLAKGSEAAPGARQTAPQANVERELLGSVPRRVEMTGRGKAVVAAWMLTVAAFGALAQQHFARLPPPASHGMLKQDGNRGTATVHKRETRQLEGDRTLYFVGYSFETESGTPVRVSRSVPTLVYDLLPEGRATEVVYQRANPENHYLPAVTSPVSTRIVFFAGGLLLAAAGFAEAQRRLHRRLVRFGAVVSGLTADVRRRGGVRSFRVNYDAEGQRRSLKATERNRELRGGQPATVVYDPATPGRAVIYRLALYRARA